jgi:hypothetical protein
MKDRKMTEKKGGSEIKEEKRNFMKLIRITECARPGCHEEGISTCSSCKSECYCGAECQKKIGRSTNNSLHAKQLEEGEMKRLRLQGRIFITMLLKYIILKIPRSLKLQRCQFRFLL